MLEQQNNYVIWLALKWDMGKVKIDYAIYPLTTEDGCWKSIVSNETFDKKVFKKTRLGYFRLVKKDGCYFSWHIMPTDKTDLEEVEKELLPKASKYLCGKMLFNQKFKNKLRERVNQILS